MVLECKNELYIGKIYCFFLRLGIVQPKLNNKFPSYLTQAALENVTILIYFASFLPKTYGNNGHLSSLKQLKLGPILAHFKFDVVCEGERERERDQKITQVRSYCLYPSFNILLGYRKFFQPPSKRKTEKGNKTLRNIKQTGKRLKTQSFHTM